IHFDPMADRGRRKNNAGIDVTDINGLLSRKKGECKDKQDDEPLPKYGSADEFYELEEEIGKGAYGIVKKCIDKRSKQVCAAKIVKTSNSKIRKETMKEIQLMIALGHHKKLVGLIDAYHTPFEVVMILELVCGGELFERIVEEDYLMEEDAIDYVRQVLEGLKYMHSKNIVHLDLKPENILCVSKDSMNIKLVDFGLAQQLKDGEDVKSSFGTPDFVAPEVIRMHPVSKASDMWLSGLMPFSGETDKDTLIKVAKADWDFDDECFDDLTEEAKDFIEDLLQKEPSERLSIRECLEHPWLTNQVKAAHRIDTVKHKSFLAKTRWKKSINALVAVRRISSLLPSLANRRPSMDTALLAARKADKSDDPEERKSSVPTLSSGKTGNGLDSDDDLENIRRPRSNTFNSPSRLTVDDVLIGNSLGNKQDDSRFEEKKQEPSNNNNESKERCVDEPVKISGQQSQQSRQPRPHEQIVLKINPNELQSGLPAEMQIDNDRSTKSLDLAITTANVKTHGSDINPGQKITVHVNTSTTTNKRDSGDSIPAIVLNDDDPLTPEVFVTPGSPRKISSENYFFTHETTVDSSTYVLDSWTMDSRSKTEQWNKPDSKVCIRTVDQKGQTITVKLDGFSSVELPVDKSTCSHVRRASTGSEAIEFFTKTIQQKLI
ncbi:hypothetical protein QZH41_016978, partial [Actinostola sp. cb2023]